MESVADEILDGRITVIRDEATEDCLEHIAKHLDAMAKLLLRAKEQLGFRDTVADQEAFKLAVDEASELVSEIAFHPPKETSEVVANCDRNDVVGVYSEHVIDHINSCVENALNMAAKSLYRGL